MSTLLADPSLRRSSCSLVRSHKTCVGLRGSCVGFGAESLYEFTVLVCRPCRLALIAFLGTEGAVVWSPRALDNCFPGVILPVGSIPTPSAIGLTGRHRAGATIMRQGTSSIPRSSPGRPHLAILIAVIKCLLHALRPWPAARRVRSLSGESARRAGGRPQP